MINRFFGAAGPVITFTKCHDTQEHLMYYDLFLNGKFDGRYLLDDFLKRIEEVAYEL